MQTVNSGARNDTCTPPHHLGPVHIIRYWGRGGRYRARRCEHCALEWRERMLRFGRRGNPYWQRAILDLTDLPR